MNTYRLGDGMEWLNYHHLFYFWVVARQGSIVAASRTLRLSHPTISTQIRRFEEVLGVDLFERRGRGLVLTEMGVTVLRYADGIFRLGGELLDTVKGGTEASVLRLRVGVLDLFPKSVTHRLLGPAFSVGPLHLVVREARSLDALLAEMASHELDLVLTDRPAGRGLPIQVHNHRLGQSSTVFVARSDLAEGMARDFPSALHQQAVILPSSETWLRRALDAWFERHGVAPRVVAEVDDSALMKVLAEAGVGACAIPRAVEEEVVRRYGLRRVGEVDVVQHFYAVSPEKRITHPAVQAIRRAALEEVFV